MTFPLSPVPTQYKSVTPSALAGIYYAGGSAPAFTLGGSGATAYAVRDFYGTVVTSGSVSGTSVIPTTPVGGWSLGWYRLYLTGPNTDSLYGNSYGSTNFIVIRNDSRFPDLPASAPSFGGESRNPRLKGLLGIGQARLLIGDVTNLGSGADGLTAVQSSLVEAKAYWSVPTKTAFADSARPRPLLTNFPQETVDSVVLSNTAINNTVWLRLYAKTEAVNGSTTFASLGAGTTSGAKVTIYSPDSSTVVETYDNMASADAAAVAINAASVYVKAFIANGGTPGTLAPTAIGRSRWNGVVTVVSTLYPDVSRFEGPSNEPALSAETAHRMRLFAAAVHTGNASAIACGPCPVTINASSWRPFLDAGGGAWCDEISFHSYNAMTNGSLSLGRYTLQAFKDLLASYGLGSKPLWDTEATNALKSVYGVYHPRRSRVMLLETLLWEQYGVPRERNIAWYDNSHGFWSFPTWMFHGDGTPNPECALYRTLAEETFGQTHSSRLDFGTIGDRIFLGSIYASAGTSTVVLMATTAMPGATVTLTITGTAAPLTVIDGWGNSTTIAITSGAAVIPVSEVPTYVRLPAGAGASVYTVNDWPPLNINGQGTSSARAATTAVPGIRDGVMPTAYPPAAGEELIGAGSPPDSATLTWATATRVDRVIVFCGQAIQIHSTLVDFDIQTSIDGSTWVTQATVTRPTPSSFRFGSSSTSTGCQYETFWDEQWIFDVPLPGPVTCVGIRINVRATSYGGEPDAQSVAGAIGQGDDVQRVCIQEIAVLCDRNTRKEFLRN